MPRTRKKRKQMSDINVVPYIDVMLVLLIIFMVTAPLLTQGVNVNLPKTAAKVMPPQKTEPLIVTVNAKGQYFLNTSGDPKSPVSDSELINNVVNELKRNPDRKIYVRGDESASYGEVVQAMVLLQRAGASSVGLITDNTTLKR